MKFKFVLFSLVLSILLILSNSANATDKKVDKKATIEAPKKEEKKVETKKDEKAGQCEATTKKGTQCTREASVGKFCKQHSK